MKVSHHIHLPSWLPGFLCHVIEEDGQVNEDEKETDFDGDTEEPPKKKGICTLILRFLGSNFGLFIVLG